MSTKHTPGPWGVFQRHRAAPTYVTADHDLIDIALMADGDEKTLAANARLIAAAPQMLEALREIEHLLSRLLESNEADNEVLPEAALAEARAAIAKAEGAQQ